MSLFLASAENVQWFSQQHNRDAKQRYQDEHPLYDPLAVKHELLAAIGGNLAREQHHVDE